MRTSEVSSERTDAARNRGSILAAARAAFHPERTSAVTVDEIAAAAGVGKGTIFRRFGDCNGLIEATIAPAVATLRELVETGPPPLGPGAEAAEAFAAYLDALLDFVWVQFWIAELARRIDTAQPGADSEYLAMAVFTNLRADVLVT